MPKTTHLSGGTEKGQTSVRTTPQKEKQLRQEPHIPGPQASLGFAKRFRPTLRTEEWMTELRAGEEEP